MEPMTGKGLSQRSVRGVGIHSPSHLRSHGSPNSSSPERPPHAGISAQPLPRADADADASTNTAPFPSSSDSPGLLDSSDVPGDVIRVRIDVGYDGTGFHGWATQPGLRTVQGVLEDQLATIFRQHLGLTVAGRTDAGVHARGQVAHFDIERDQWLQLGQRLAAAASRQGSSKSNVYTPDRSNTHVRAVDTGAADIFPSRPYSLDMSAAAFTRRINKLLSGDYAHYLAEHHLPAIRGTSDIIIHCAKVVDSSFDARFSATGRRYEYLLGDESCERNPVEARYTWWLEDHLNVFAMNEAAQIFLGEHDFLSFCRPREGATTIRTLRELSVTPFMTSTGGTCMKVSVHADAFCHSMVRSLVGALVEVGSGRRNPTWCSQLIHQPSRQHAAPIVPALGLSLTRVDYPEESQWGSQSQKARVMRELKPSSCCE